MRIKDVLKIKPITTVIDFESRDKSYRFLCCLKTLVITF